MATGEPMFIYWWLTPMQVEILLHRAGLSSADYTMEIVGNLFSHVAYRMNLPAEQLTRHELEKDPDHPLLICARGVKASEWNLVTRHSAP
jgi:hypothetical protein